MKRREVFSSVFGGAVFSAACRDSLLCSIVSSFMGLPSTLVATSGELAGRTVGRRVGSIKASKGVVSQVAWHPNDSSLVVALPADGSLAKINPNGHVLWRIARKTGLSGGSFSYDPSGKFMVTPPAHVVFDPSGDQCLSIVDDANGQEMRTLTGLTYPHGGRPWAEKFLLNRAGTKIVALDHGTPRHVLVFEGPDWHLVQNWVIDEIYESVAWGPDERSFLGTTNEGFIHEWSLDEPGQVRRVGVSNDGLGPLVMMADQRTIIVSLGGSTYENFQNPKPARPIKNNYATNKSSVWKMDWPSGNVLHRYESFLGVDGMSVNEAKNIGISVSASISVGVSAYFFEPNGTRVLAGVDLGNLNQSIQGHSTSISPDGEYATIGDQGTLVVYKLNLKP